MKFSPCDNCKRKDGCAVPIFIEDNLHLGVFRLSDEMVNMPILVSIVSMDTKNEKVVLECDAVSFINKPENTYEALLNSKPRDDCHEIGAALRDRCKKGDCGGCSGH